MASMTFTGPDRQSIRCDAQVGDGWHRTSWYRGHDGKNVAILSAWDRAPASLPGRRPGDMDSGLHLTVFDAGRIIIGLFDAVSGEAYLSERKAGNMDNAEPHISGAQEAWKFARRDEIARYIGYTFISPPVEIVAQ
jgi:hypothetical protein